MNEPSPTPTPPQPRPPILAWYEASSTPMLYYGTIRLGWVINDSFHPKGPWAAFGPFREFIGDAPTREQAAVLVVEAVRSFTTSLSAALPTPKEPT